MWFKRNSGDEYGKGIRSHGTCALCAKKLFLLSSVFHLLLSTEVEN